MIAFGTGLAGRLPEGTGRGSGEGRASQGDWGSRGSGGFFREELSAGEEAGNKEDQSESNGGERFHGMPHGSDRGTRIAI